MSLRCLYLMTLGVIALGSQSPRVFAADPAAPAPAPKAALPLAPAAASPGPAATKVHPVAAAAPGATQHAATEKEATEKETAADEAARASEQPPNPTAPGATPSTPGTLSAGGAPDSAPLAASGPAQAETAKQSPAPRSSGTALAPDPSKPSWSAAGNASVADAPSSDRPVPPTRVDFWAGLRNTQVTSAGFDAFAEDDALAQFSVGAGVTLDSDPSYAIAVLGFADLGGRSASFRGQDTELGATRLGLGPELRLPLIPRLYLLGRATPIAVRWSAQVDPGVTGSSSDDGWTFGAEAAVGVAFALAQLNPPGATALGLWLRAEGGYSWAADFTPELGAGSGAPLRTADLELQDVALRGAQFRIALGFSL